MKSIITILALSAGLVQTSFAQDAPSTVTVAFKAKFPTATKVEWEKENEAEWEAEFMLNGVEYSANFSKDGTWMETEHEIKINELPDAVKKTIKNDFEGYTLKEVEMVERRIFTGYEVELKNEKETLEVLLDKTGKVIKKKVEKEEEED